MDTRARVTTGFWPAMTVRSATAPSMSDFWSVAAPTPQFRTILESRGTSMMFPSSRSAFSFSRISSS